MHVKMYCFTVSEKFILCFCKKRKKKLPVDLNVELSNLR